MKINDRPAKIRVEETTKNGFRVVLYQVEETWDTVFITRVYKGKGRKMINGNEYTKNYGEALEWFYEWVDAYAEIDDDLCGTKKAVNSKANGIYSELIITIEELPTHKLTAYKPQGDYAPYKLPKVKNTLPALGNSSDCKDIKKGIEKYKKMMR